MDIVPIIVVVIKSATSVAGNTINHCVNSVPNTESGNKLDTILKTTVAVGKSKTNILLQTACTFAYSIDEEHIPVRVLLDNGS